MFRWIGFGMAAALLLGMSCLPGSPASAQPAAINDGIVGTWILVSVASQMDDGTRGEPFGPNPKGIMMFSRDAHFSLFQSRAELPRFAADDRARATAEEAATVVRASIAYFGTNTADGADRSFLLRLEGSTYLNLMGRPAQRRIVTSLTATDLQFSNPRTPSGVTIHTVCRRATPQ